MGGREGEKHGKFGGHRGKRSANNKGQRSKDSPKKSINDYWYFLGGPKQASEYDNTTSYIINHIRKTYNDGKPIALALEDFKAFNTSVWLPGREYSMKSEDDEATKENEEFDRVYNSKLNIYKKRIYNYEMNITKAFGLLWERCTQGMKNKF